jgi:hypothetical protein
MNFFLQQIFPTGIVISHDIESFYNDIIIINRYKEFDIVHIDVQVLDWFLSEITL